MDRKICIIGHGRHGKDTVAQIIKYEIGLDFESSSMMAAKIFIYDELKNKFNYSSFEECYEDRHSHRSLWHDLICDYNKEDKSRLAKDIMKENSIYVGMRSNEELNKCKENNIFNLVIGVFDSEKPLEDSSSFDIDIFKQSDFIITTGDLDKTTEKVKQFCKLLK